MLAYRAGSNSAKNIQFLDPQWSEMGDAPGWSV
jgi:hypothetical protein